MPRQVFATGRVGGEAVVHVNALYLWDKDGPSIACASGALTQKGRQFVHGYEVYFEQATVVYESGVQPPTVMTADGEVQVATLSGSGDPVESFTAELQAAVNGVDSGTAPDLLSGALARDALVLCHKEIESVRTGRIVNV
jgi:hypothetical protein